MSHFQFPILIQAFNRPQYLEKVLRSLKVQTLTVLPSNVWLFLDGPRLHEGGQLERSDLSAVEECKSLFSFHFNADNIFASQSNIGICRLRTNMEEHGYLELASEWILILEDDLELGPCYLELLEKLRHEFPYKSRIASISAFGTTSTQTNSIEPYSGALIEEVTDQMYAWGSLESRRFWLQKRLVVSIYESLLHGKPYRERSIVDIEPLFYHLSSGLKFSDCDNKSNTSQDNIKAMLAYLLGGLRLNTTNNYAKYIGKYGENYTPEHYESEGFGNTLVRMKPPEKLSFLSREDYLHKYMSYVYYFSLYPKTETLGCVSSSPRLLSGPSSQLVHEMQQRGSLAAEHLAPAQLQAIESFKLTCWRNILSFSEESTLLYIIGQGSRFIEAMNTIPISLEWLLLGHEEFVGSLKELNSFSSVIIHSPTIWRQHRSYFQIIRNLSYLLLNYSAKVVIGSIDGWAPDSILISDQLGISLSDSLSTESIKSSYPESLAAIANVNPEIHILLDLDSYDIVSVYESK